MNSALFTDFDGVLTEEAVNMQLARMLGVESTLAPMEDDFRFGRIPNSDFNRVFVPLFQKTKFSERFMKDAFKDVQLRDGAEQVLRSRNVFLVTSGPSYYIDLLAKEYGIPNTQVYCSRYEFDSSGGLKGCVAPASAQSKASFVQKHARSFALTIGLGDTADLDGPFISHCRVKLLLGEYRAGFLGVRELEQVMDLVTALQTADSQQHRRPEGVKPRVFIGSSKEGKNLASAIHTGIGDFAEPVLWDQGVFGVGRNTFDELVREANRADYAVFVAKADDRVTMRGETRASPRDNIVFEMGLFAGRLGIENTCIVACRDDELKLPTDLAGITLATYPRRQDDNWRAWVEPVIEPIRQALIRSSKSR